MSKIECCGCIHFVNDNAKINTRKYVITSYGGSPSSARICRGQDFERWSDINDLKVADKSLISKIGNDKYQREVRTPFANVELHVFEPRTEQDGYSQDVVSAQADAINLVVRKLLLTLNELRGDYSHSKSFSNIQFPDMCVCIFLTDVPKRVARENAFKALTSPRYINSGVTIRWREEARPRLVCVYRRHEFVPILAHEFVHALEMDQPHLNEHIVHSELRHDLEREGLLSTSSKIFLPNESVTDVLATIALKRTFSQDIDYGVLCSHAYTQEQIVRELCADMHHGLEQHSTCAISYYVLRATLLRALNSEKQSDTPLRRSLFWTLFHNNGGKKRTEKGDANVIVQHLRDELKKYRNKRSSTLPIITDSNTNNEITKEWNMGRYVSFSRHALLKE